ncbi:hypothetical protein, partial [Nesterenkonia ebinurensis]|uniref:hypothetical protein n=1 Tax=Nesterenkonia ebinurensis TaxID=2608252 RepID=UPI001CC63689
MSVEVEGLTEAGDYELVVRYTGATDFESSSSDPVTVTVVPAAPASIAVSGPHSVTETESVSYRVQASDTYGNVIGWVTSDTEITSSVEADRVREAEVTFVFTPELADRTLIFSYTGEDGQEITTEVDVQVTSAVESLAVDAPDTAVDREVLPVVVTALDADGEPLGEVTDYAGITSSVDSDEITGGELTVVGIGEREVTAEYRGQSASAEVSVVPAAAGVLEVTGSD